MNDKRYNPDSSHRTPEETRRINLLIHRYQRKKKRRRAIILAILIISAVFVYTWVRAAVRPPEINQEIRAEEDSDKTEISTTPTEQKPLRKDDFYTFVIVGKDDGNGNTDTIILGALDVTHQKLNLISIPRDTLVNVPWEPRKANTLLEYSETGVDGFKESLGDLTGFVVDSFFIVNLNAFVSLIDAVDGLDFDVPIDMDYEDPQQDLYIHLKAGYQTLDGEKALEMVRFRSGYPNQDIGRIETQQMFLKALAKKCLRLENWDKIDDYAGIFRENVDTDLDLGSIIWYGQQIIGLDSEDIAFHTVPEYYNDLIDGTSYCTIFMDEWLEMLNATVNPFLEEIVISDLNILTRDQNGDLYATSGLIAER
jgi:LCP family protein required for cell wall assembly